MTGIHLFVPMLHRRDAVGEHTRSLRDRLVGEGVECRIYIEMPDPDTVGETRPYREYEADARPGDVLVYQMATRSDMAQWTGCIAGALTEAEFAGALTAAGLVDVEIRETHRVHEHAASAIIRARKPA